MPDELKVYDSGLGWHTKYEGMQYNIVREPKLYRIHPSPGYPLRTTWVKTMSGWKKIEDEVDWTKLSHPMSRIREEWIEKAIFVFKRVDALLPPTISDRKTALPFVPSLPDDFVSVQELLEYLRDAGILLIRKATSQVLECIDRISRDHAIIGQADLVSIEAVVTGPCGLGVDLVGKVVLVIGNQKCVSFVVQQSDVLQYAY
jgi:hypothetical protein